MTMLISEADKSARAKAACMASGSAACANTGVAVAKSASKDKRLPACKNGLKRLLKNFGLLSVL